MSRSADKSGESADINPEDHAKHELTEWLEDYGADVYWEKNNAWNHSVFQVRGEKPATEKPDLLIRLDGDVFAVETKAGVEKSNIYDARWQIVRYWTNYYTEQTGYVATGVEVDVDGFLTATRWSRRGHLFPPQYEKRLESEHFGEGRRWAIADGQLPPAEYTMTEQHVRNLWRHVKRVADAENPPLAGSLLSSALEGDSSDQQAPAILATEGKYQGWRVYR